MLIATACSAPREGQARWTLELLADEMVRLTEHDTLSRATVGRRLAGGCAAGTPLGDAACVGSTIQHPTLTDVPFPSQCTRRGIRAA
ncbi:MAG: hypothetical protein V7606_3645, partial [Burkholderiales bacterium]